MRSFNGRQGARGERNAARRTPPWRTRPPPPSGMPVGCLDLRASRPHRPPQSAAGPHSAATPHRAAPAAATAAAPAASAPGPTSAPAPGAHPRPHTLHPRDPRYPILGLDRRRPWRRRHRRPGGPPGSISSAVDAILSGAGGGPGRPVHRRPAAGGVRATDDTCRTAPNLAERLRRGESRQPVRRRRRRRRAAIDTPASAECRSVPSSQSPPGEPARRWPPRVRPLGREACAAPKGALERAARCCTSRSTGHSLAVPHEVGLVRPCK